MVGQRHIVVPVGQAKSVEDGYAAVNLAWLQFAAPPADEIALPV